MIAAQIVYPGGFPRPAPTPPSALSVFDFRVQRLEFVACVVDGELPVDAALFVVACHGPGFCLVAELLDVAKATTVQTLTRQAAQFVFRDVQPTSMLGGEAEVETTSKLARLAGGKGLVEGSHRVRVQVVADENHFFCCRITCAQKFLLVQTHEDTGVEFWMARDLQEVLGYARWENFAKVIEKARTACKNTGYDESDHFLDVTKMISISSQSGSSDDFAVKARPSEQLRTQNRRCGAAVGGP
jgi:hypothetical protein